MKDAVFGMLGWREISDPKSLRVSNSTLAVPTLYPVGLMVSWCTVNPAVLRQRDQRGARQREGAMSGTYAILTEGSIAPSFCLAVNGCVVRPLPH